MREAKINLSIRNLTPSDIDPAARILSAAFRTGEDRPAELQRYLSFQPDGWFGAEWDGTLAGTGGVVSFGTFAYLGGMAVEPSMQRRGIARTIMHHLLAWLDARHCPSVLLDASQYGQPLYSDLGFVVEGQSSTFQNDAPQQLSQLPENVSRFSEHDIPSLTEFDAPIFGAARANVLTAYLAAFPDRSFVARDASGRIAGFIIAQSNRLGPWVAQDNDAAEKLLRAALSLRYDQPVRAIVPSPNATAGELLTRYDFQFSRAQAHMCRSAAYPARQREHIYGQASFAIG